MKKIGHLISRWFLIIATVLLVTETISPPPALAQWTDFVNFAVNAISSVYTVYQDVSADYMKLKETVLDPLAWALAKTLLQSITADVVNWINSGYQGSPAFISNPQGFFLDVADQATGAFIANSGPLSSLCSPFSLDIRLNLALHTTVPSRQRYACTLSTIIKNAQNSHVGISGTVTDNGTVIAGGSAGASINGGATINGFMGGDFSQGGWPAFVALTTEPQNNPFGASLTEQADLQNQISSRQATIKADVAAGGGFMSYPKCKDLGTVNSDAEADQADAIAGNDPNVTTKVNSDGSITYQICHMETPGSTISAALNKQLGSGSDSLVAADEIDEVLSAAFNQLLKSVLTGGLYSSSQTSSGGTAAVMTTLRTDTTGTAIQTNITALSNNIDKYMSDTLLYKSVRDRTVTAINDVQTYANSMYSLCEANGWPANGDAIQGIMTSQIAPLLTLYQGRATDAATRLQVLTSLQTSVNSPSATDPNELNSLGIQYADMLSSNTLTTATDVSNANTDLASVTSTTGTIHASLAQYDMLCRQSHNGGSGSN